MSTLHIRSWKKGVFPCLFLGPVVSACCLRCAVVPSHNPSSSYVWGVRLLEWGHQGVILTILSSEGWFCVDITTSATKSVMKINKNLCAPQCRPQHLAMTHPRHTHLELWSCLFLQSPMTNRRPRRTLSPAAVPSLIPHKTMPERKISSTTNF